MVRFFSVIWIKSFFCRRELVRSDGVCNTANTQPLEITRQFKKKNDVFVIHEHFRLFALQGLEDIVPIDYHKVQPQPEGFDLVKQPSKSNFGQ